MPYTNKLRLAFGGEIEVKGRREVETANLLRNHPRFYILATKVKSEYINGGGCEIVLPPLEIDSPQTLSFLRELYSFLESSGYSINKSCGHHIHIGLRPINISQEEFYNRTIEHFVNNDRNYAFQCSTDLIQFETTRDVVFRYVKHQTFFSSIMPKSRRGNRMCKEVSYSCLDNIKNSLNATQLAEAIKSDGHRGSNSSDKFYTVNVLPYLPKNTIEFRQHSGTLNYEKITNWIHLLFNMFNYSHNNRVKLINCGDLVNQPLTNIFRPRTKLYKAFNLMQTQSGCTTRDLMTECNIEDARSVRRTINTLRTRLGSPKAVICQTQEFYGHRNGESNGLYDLNGYKIPGHVEVRSQGEKVVDYSSPDSPYKNLRESLKIYFNNRIETLR